MKRHFNRPVAFTGAGISVASGLPTFDSVWDGRPVRDLLCREYFERDPSTFYRFFWDNVAIWTRAQPNEAHRALAKCGMPVITRNIDGLHQKAGSREVYEIHGHLRTLTCVGCGESYGLTAFIGLQIPLCEQCGEMLSPDVVLFGDGMRRWEEAVSAMLNADLVLVIGSSLQVAPACYLPQMARDHGADVMIINERAEVELPRWMEENL